MNTRPTFPSAAIEAPWGSLIPDDQWDTFERGTAAIRRAGVEFVLAGALGLATYTGHWRNTKDVDIIIRAADRDRAVAAIQEAGFEDYFSHETYDRTWIFRAFRAGVIFDIIWALPNHRVSIDDGWFERAPSLHLRGRTFAAAPAEELIRVKLYVMQRERCDWVDVLNLLAGAYESIDWTWLVRRMGRDLDLLHGVLAVFNWMCPGRARTLPEWLRKQFALSPAPEGDDAGREDRHVRMFDSRPWFAPLLPADRTLER